MLRVIWESLSRDTPTDLFKYVQLRTFFWNRFHIRVHAAVRVSHRKNRKFHVSNLFWWGRTRNRERWCKSIETGKCWFLWKWTQHYELSGFSTIFFYNFNVCNVRGWTQRHGPEFEEQDPRKDGITVQYSLHREACSQWIEGNWHSKAVFCSHENGLSFFPLVSDWITEGDLFTADLTV